MLGCVQAMLGIGFYPDEMEALDCTAYKGVIYGRVGESLECDKRFLLDLTQQSGYVGFYKIKDAREG